MEVAINILKAFLVGGIFCAIGQILIDKTNLTPARILTAYVVGGVILGALGIYKPLVEFAGAGASVPLTGFGYLLADGVKKAVDTHGLWGAIMGGISATAAGITAAIFFGFICALIFKSNEKNSTLLSGAVLKVQYKLAGLVELTNKSRFLSCSAILVKNSLGSGFVNCLDSLSNNCYLVSSIVSNRGLGLLDHSFEIRANGLVAKIINLRNKHSLLS